MTPLPNRWKEFRAPLAPVARVLCMLVCAGACGRAVAVDTLRPPAPAPASEARDCTLRNSAGPADSQTVEVVLAVRAFSPGHELSRDYRELLSAGIRQFITLPAPLVLDTFDDNVAANAESERLPRFAALALNATYRTMLTRDGRLLNSRAVGGATTPDFDRAMLAALAALDTSGLLPKPPAGATWFTGDVAEIVVLVTPRPVSRAPGKTYPTDTMPAVPLLSFRTPIERLDGSVRRAHGPVPKYPPDMEAQGTEAKVMLQFVVDANGKADMSTLQVLAPVPPIDFVRSAVASVTDTHFKPMTIRGCPVRSLVQQPFLFGIGRQP